MSFRKLSLHLARHTTIACFTDGKPDGILYGVVSLTINSVFVGSQRGESATPVLIDPTFL